MARPRKAVGSHDEPVDDRDLSGILNALEPGGSWIVKVYRVRPGGSNQYLTKWEPQQVSEETIAAKYGPGKFFVRAWSESLNKWGGSKTIDISEEAAEEAGYDLESNKPSPYMIPHDNSQNDKMLAIMQQSGDKMMQMFMQNSTQQMQIMSGIFTVIAAMANGGPKLDPVALAQAMQSGKGSMAESISLVKTIFDITKDFRDGGSETPSDPLTAIATSILPKMLEGRSLIKGSQAPPDSLARNPNDGGAAPVPEPNPKVEVESPEMLQIRKIQEFVLMLKEKARQGKDPAFWADYIEENATDPGPAAILSVLPVATFEQIIEGLALRMNDPELRADPYLSWFRELHQMLLAGPEEEEEPKKGEGR